MKPADRKLRTPPRQTSQRTVDNLVNTTIGVELVDLLDAQRLIERLDTGAPHWRELEYVVSRRIELLTLDLTISCSERGC